MRTFLSRMLALMLALALLPAGFAFGASAIIEVKMDDYAISEDGSYTSLPEVALYIAAYGRLPNNFIAKKDAEALGWSSRDGNLEQVAPGMSIGGDKFGNYEKQLPTAKGRTWTECDVDSTGGFRNGKRIVFSSDGLIYYTGDHYNTFQQVSVIQPAKSESELKRDGAYTAKYDVVAYLRAYGQLPSNYVTTAEAQKSGYSEKKDNLGSVLPGRTLGGDKYKNTGNRLPSAKGRKWYQCDVNTQDGKRSKEHLIYSTDGLIYYTPDDFLTCQQVAD